MWSGSRAWLARAPLVVSAVGNTNSRLLKANAKYILPIQHIQRHRYSTIPKKASLRHVDSSESKTQKQNFSIAPLKPCTSASTCEAYDLGRVMDLMFNEGFRSSRILLPGEMAHVQFPVHNGKDKADVLILVNGTIVAWGMKELQVLEEFVPLLKRAEIRPYASIETEDMDYVEYPNGDISAENAVHVVSSSSSAGATSGASSEGAQAPSAASQSSQPFPPDLEKSTMIGDVIYLRGDEKQKLLDMAAFSSGLARSTKLAALENGMETFIGTIKELSDKLATGRHLGVHGKDVLKTTGRLLQIRGQLNLYSELIETPDLYWSEPELERLYSLLSKKLDISQRIAILNKKLDYASELVGILQTHLSEEQSTRLEWMIIILITVEVCFEIIHFSEKWM